MIKTVPGMAMAVGAALDELNWKEIVGCIAGDDTIMCAIKTADDTLDVYKRQILQWKDRPGGEEDASDR